MNASPAERNNLKVVALAGGVGGARLAEGLAQVLPAGALTVVVNIGDDFEHFGLHICPDLDTVCYTLAGLADALTGWGRSEETWRAMETVSQLGGPVWFRLGDRDLGLHLDRTRLLRSGMPLSQVTRSICQSWGIQASVLPASDDRVPTWVSTSEGELPFQEYFVHRQCQPQVSGFRFEGVESARPAPGVLPALETAGLIVICPSNPWVSIDPILAIPGIRSAIQARCRSAGAVALAVSPIIRGQTIKGPAAKMYAELGIQPSALAVASHYAGLIQAFVLDNLDTDLLAEVQGLDLYALPAQTIMKTATDRRELAEQVLGFGRSVKSKLILTE